MPEWVAVDVRNRSHAIAVTVEVPDGVVPDGHPARARVRARRLVASTSSTVGCATCTTCTASGSTRSSPTRASDPGRHEVAFRFEKDEGLGGQATLVQDGVVVGTGEVKRFTPVAFNEVMIGLTCGYEWGPAVGGDYEAPFAFNGTIVRAEVTATGPVVRDPVAEVAAILASQ